MSRPRFSWVERAVFVALALAVAFLIIVSMAGCFPDSASADQQGYEPGAWTPPDTVLPDGMELAPAEPPPPEERNPRIPSGFWAWGFDYMAVYSLWYGVPHAGRPAAQVHQESGWRKCPRSPAGAEGAAQFIPSTWEAIHRKYGGGEKGPCDPESAARAQALLMKENARSCYARGIRGERSLWICALRTYNGSPGAFFCEHRAAGRPANAEAVAALCGACGRPGWACRENVEYGPRILDRWWPMYRVYLS